MAEIHVISQPQDAVEVDGMFDEYVLFINGKDSSVVAITTQTRTLRFIQIREQFMLKYFMEYFFLRRSWKIHFSKQPCKCNCKLFRPSIIRSSSFPNANSKIQPFSSISPTSTSATTRVTKLFHPVEF